MDVENVFPNENLSEEVYMKPLPSLSIEPSKVCHFLRALYGLKQLHELGLPSSALPSLTWVILQVIMILPYFFVTPTKALFCSSYMWMIRS